MRQIDYRRKFNAERGEDDAEGADKAIRFVLAIARRTRRLNTLMVIGFASQSSALSALTSAASALETECEASKEGQSRSPCESSIFSP